MTDKEFYKKCYSRLKVKPFEAGFRKITLEDRDWISAVCREDGGMSVHINFTAYFLAQAIWNDQSRPFMGCLVKHPYVDEAGSLCCLYPVGAPEKRQKAMREIARIYAGRVKRYVIYASSDETLAEVQRMFGSKVVSVKNDPDWQDYMLDAQEQIAMAGSAFSSRRNKIARFNKTYNWTYEEITKDNMAECLAISANWYEGREESKETLGEQASLKLAFEHYDELGLQGGLMRIDGKAVAFGIGVPFNDTVYLDLYRKALNEYRDVNTVFMQEYMRRYCGQYQYINDAEDMGMPGLRMFKSKLHAKFMIPSYEITIEK